MGCNDCLPELSGEVSLLCVPLTVATIFLTRARPSSDEMLAYLTSTTFRISLEGQLTFYLFPFSYIYIIYDFYEKVKIYFLP